MLIIQNGKKFSKKIRWLKFGLISFSSLISILVIVSIVWSIIEVKSQKPIIPQNVISKTLDRTIESFSHFRFPLKRILGFNSDFPTLSLDIKLKDYAKLEEITKNKGNGRREIYVPAKIRLDDKIAKVKIRLQGDREIHWADPKRWSFRVEVKDDTILGMRKFTIQHPVTRNYVYEWLFHDFLKREGLIGLNYQFITFNVNGKSKGVYAVEEKSDKILIESNKRRNGPIFKFESSGGLDYDNFWENIRISPYQESNWSKNNPILLAQASDLLSSFINGDKSVEEVFDTEKLAKFFAIVDIFSMFHATIPDGIRLYYNPVTRIFEPIGNDGHFLEKAYPTMVSQLNNFGGDQGFWGYGKWYERLFNIDDGKNLELYEKYIQELERLSSSNYLENYFDEVDDELNRILDFIYSDFPYADLWTMHPKTGISPLFYFDENKILDKRSAIKERLTLNSPLYLNGIRLNNESLKLNINNKSKFPVKIVEVTLNNQILQPSKDEYIESILNQNKRKPKEVSFIFKKIPESKDELIGKIKYSVIGTNEIYDQIFVIRNSSLGDKKYGNFEKFNFFKVNDSIITLGPGDYEFNEHLVIPKTHSLQILPGTNINLLNSSRIIAYSPIIMKGNKDNRIKIYSSDSTGQGLLVIQANGKSFMNYVDFNDQSLNDLSQSISSVLTFYESNVVINNSSFSKNISEDIINIVRAEFDINQISINDAISDGIDVDFGSGNISNSNFFNIGNDSIDLSGSLAKLSQITSHRSGDKAVSIGEGSSVFASDISILNSKIGFAIKDSSYLELIESSIQDTEVGFTVFQKKLEFKPSKADIWRYSSKNVNQEFLLEEGSTIIFDGVTANPNSVELRDELY
jgi:hypothetical protein